MSNIRLGVSSDSEYSECNETDYIENSKENCDGEIDETDPNKLIVDESDGGDESSDQSIYSVKSNKFNARDSEVFIMKKKPIRCLTSDTESDSEPVVDETETLKEEDTFNTMPIDSRPNSRVSNHFQFNAAGILNSTSVHSAVIDHHGKENADLDTSVVALFDGSSDIIEVSSGEEFSNLLSTPCKVPVRQPAVIQQTLPGLLGIASRKLINAGASTERKPFPVATVEQQSADMKIKLVTKAEYDIQQERVEDAETELVKMQSMAEKLVLEALPDKGELLHSRMRAIHKKLILEQDKLKNMVVSEEVTKRNAEGANVEWEDIQEGANKVLPKTFGKQAMSTYNAQKALTMDRLQQLHGAIQTCPKEHELEDEPKGMKVSLMPHQKRALAWLLFRENAKPSGGILADDMGLGKTLSIISLILKSAEINGDLDGQTSNRNGFTDRNTKHNGGSLIVCPASLINQWSSEIDNRLKRGLLSYYLFHGARRENSAKKLAKYDVVITTYSIVGLQSATGTLNRIRWRRIILDEAHQIRNPKTSISAACCQLSGKSRWALTGTPMHNKEMDMYALLRFLRCTPFDDIQVWKRWVNDKSSGGQERLHTIISSLMLRRTKAELMEKGFLNTMPEKQWLLVKVELDKSEQNVYHKVLIFSQTLFAQFLHQRAEKNFDLDARSIPLSGNTSNQEYSKMRQKLLKLNKVKNVSQHEILVLLLRLRQICCHPSLITAMLDEGLEDEDRENELSEHMNLLEQLEKLNLEDAPAEDNKEDDAYNPSESVGNTDRDAKVSVKEAVRGHLSRSDEVFQKERASSKITKLLEVLQETVLPKGDKAIIVSQWSSYLILVGMHLKNLNVEFSQLDGKVPVHKRMDMVSKFNDPKDSMRVLLLTLTAGGVGLNLVGANHLFLLDLHWNPQLESQAQDRIYRMGQTKPVFIYKFMAVDTIEERIKLLQETKLNMANAILTGSKQVVESKLTLDDLKMIFGFGADPGNGVV